MKLTISKEIFNKYKGLNIGVVFAKGIDNQGKGREIEELVKFSAVKAASDSAGLESPSKHPNVIPWRQAYKSFGSDPHDYRCSSEALLRQAIKGNEISGINKLVDLYNHISLKYVVPVGGEDLDKVEGDILLDFAQGFEPFVRLGGTENEPPSAGEAVYKDKIGVLCRRWNWREADRTKLTENTKNAVIVIEGLLPVQKEAIEAAAEELAGLIKKYCGGETHYEILNPDKNIFDSAA